MVANPVMPDVVGVFCKTFMASVVSYLYMYSKPLL